MAKKFNSHQQGRRVFEKTPFLRGIFYTLYTQKRPTVQRKLYTHISFLVRC